MFLKPDRYRFLLSRLRAVTGLPEVGYRFAQWVQKHLTDRLQTYLKPPKITVSHNLHGYKKVNEVPLLPAEQIRSFHYLDHTIDDIFSVNKWRYDYKNKVESPVTYYANIRRQNFKQVGDIKYVSEVSRFHHLPVLAACYRQKGDKYYLEVITRHIREWQVQNPFLRSVNWTSGIEVAIRAINWICALKLVGFNNLPHDFVTTFKQVIYRHAFYLRHHLSRYSSANNHLLAELAGLIVICSHFEFLKSKAWLQFAAQEMQDELLRQTHLDGFNKEQSTHYHAFTLWLFLVSFKLLDMQNMHIVPEAKLRLQKMAEILDYFVVNNKETISVGDDDGGYLFYPYVDEQFNIYGSALAAAAIYFQNPEWLAKYNRFDLGHYLLFGDDCFRVYKKLSQQATSSERKSPSRLFRASGYFFIHGKNNHICFDVGPLGMSTMAGHGHADLLSFVLYLQDEPVIVDPGTFQYHTRHWKWRKYFRSVHAHNTISVDNKDLARQAGRMMWFRKPRINIINCSTSGEEIFCEATHNAFLRQGVHAIHTRRFSYFKETDVYCIKDQLEGHGRHQGYFYLHFHPDTPSIRKKGSHIYVKTSKNKRLVISSEIMDNAELIKGDEEQPLGWYSRHFDHKEPAYTLKVPFAYDNDCTITTKIQVQ